MPQKINLPSGAVEIVDTPEEKQSKNKHKTKKKASDLTDAEVKELVFQIAKKLNLISDE